MDLILIGIGIVLLLQWIKRIYAVMWSKGIHVTLSFSEQEVYPGDKVTLTEVVTNNKWLPLPMVKVKFAIDKSLEFIDMVQDVHVSDRCYKSEVFSLLFYQKITRRLPFTCRKRGYFTIDSLDLVSSDLFMVRVLATVLFVEESITVYPKPIDYERVSIPYNRIMGTLLSKRYDYEDNFEFRGIREYQTYDTMRAINWNASARTGDLKVNVYDYTAGQEVILLLNLEDEGIWKYEMLKEESISIAADLALRLTQQGILVSLISNGGDTITKAPLFIDSGSDESHRKAIITGLSRIELNHDMTEFKDLMKEHRKKIEKTSMIVMISTCKKAELQKEYSQIVTDVLKGVWIFPHHPDMNHEFTIVDKDYIIPWEVAQD